MSKFVEPKIYGIHIDVGELHTKATPVYIKDNSLSAICDLLNSKRITCKNITLNSKTYCAWYNPDSYLKLSGVNIKNKSKILGNMFICKDIYGNMKSLGYDDVINVVNHINNEVLYFE